MSTPEPPRHDYVVKSGSNMRGNTFWWVACRFGCEVGSPMQVDPGDAAIDVVRFRREDTSICFNQVVQSRADLQASKGAAVMIKTAVDKLNDAQRAQWDDLRGQRMSDWPADLSSFVKAYKPHNGEDIMEAIAEWVLTR